MSHDNFIRVRSVDSGKVYRITIFKDGTIVCECGQFSFRCRRGRDECKHITAWKDGNVGPLASAGHVLDRPEDFR